MNNESTSHIFEKLSGVLTQKLEDRDKSIDLKLENMVLSIQLNIKDAVSEGYRDLEDKLDVKIKEAVSNQDKKIKWGIEILRIAGVAVAFMLSIKAASSI